MPMTACTLLAATTGTAAVVTAAGAAGVVPMTDPAAAAAVAGCSRCCLMCASSKLKRAGFAVGVRMAIAAVTAAVDCGGEVTVPCMAAGECAGVGGQGMTSGDVGTECVGGGRARPAAAAAALQHGAAVVDVALVEAAAAALVGTAPTAVCTLPLLELLELEFEC